MKKLVCGILLFVLLLTFSYIPSLKTANAVSFSDVNSDYWAADEIGNLASSGILNGYPDGTFKPDNNVTRAEFAKIISLALGYSPNLSASQKFPDVARDHWAFGYVASAIDHGLVQGYPDGTFGPSRNVTKAEILTIIARAQNWLAGSGNHFIDVASTHWAYGYIEACLGHQVVYVSDPQITGAGNFYPDNAATRAQTCVFTDRMMKASGEVLGETDIDSNGGTVTGPGGISLIVPAGGVSSQTTFSIASAPAGSLPSGLSPIPNSTYEIYASGEVSEAYLIMQIPSGYPTDSVLATHRVDGEWVPAFGIHYADQIVIPATSFSQYSLATPTNDTGSVAPTGTEQYKTYDLDHWTVKARSAMGFVVGGEIIDPVETETTLSVKIQAYNTKNFVWKLEGIGNISSRVEVEEVYGWIFPSIVSADLINIFLTPEGIASIQVNVSGDNEFLSLYPLKSGADAFIAEVVDLVCLVLGGKHLPSDPKAGIVSAFMKVFTPVVLENAEIAGDIGQLKSGVTAGKVWKLFQDLIDVCITKDGDHLVLTETGKALRDVFKAVGWEVSSKVLKEALDFVDLIGRLWSFIETDYDLLSTGQEDVLDFQFIRKNQQQLGFDTSQNNLAYGKDTSTSVTNKQTGVHGCQTVVNGTSLFPSDADWYFETEDYPLPQWIKIDLGATYQVNTIDTLHSAAYTWNRYARPKQLKLEFDDGKSELVTRSTVNGYTWCRNTFPTHSTRFIKISILSKETNGGEVYPGTTGFDEINIYGP